MRIPPMLSAPAGSPLAQATEDLIGCVQPLAQLVAALPPSAERDQACARLNECVLWTHQALAAAMPGRVALAHSLPS